MIFDRTQLESQKMNELKHLILSIGGDPSQPNETKDQLIERILLVAAKQPEAEPGEKDDMAKGIEQTPENSIEEVLKAVNPHILRGMKVYHDKDNNSWMFQLKLKPAMIRNSNTGEMTQVERHKHDSGTLNQPLVTIKRCADVLMQKAPRLEEVRQMMVSSAYEEVA